MKNYIHLLLILLLVSCNNRNDANRMYKASEAIYQKGDSPSYSKKNIDDNGWSETIKETKGDEIFWSRKTIEITKKLDKFETTGIYMQVFGAYEVFWDGVLIGTNGKPGFESSTAKTGSFIQSFVIPRHLLDIGNHSLALRTSMFYENEEDRDYHICIDNYKRIIREPLLGTILINILIGIFLIASIYYFLLYLNDIKKYELLLFSVASLLFFLLAIMEYLKFYIPIHYSNFYLRLQIIGVLIFLISFLVPYYFAVQFKFKYYKSFMPIYAILLLIVFVYNIGHYDFTALLLGQMMWVSSTIIISYAIYKKQKSAIIILIGLILSFIVYKSSVYDISLFVSFGIILLCMFNVLSVKLKEQRQAFEFSIAESTRLKYELLKKKIQPHFLMNTLTSLIDWVEEAPKKGVKFIEALAEEFDLLNQVENETLIPLSQEIKICKSHLNIMKYRKEINYLWQDEGVLDDETQTIPPAVIHTLLENGITHCLPNNDNEMSFKLIVENEAEKQKITFLTIAKVRRNKTEIKGGTGFKYVKARLTESYGNKWILTSQATKNGWKNEIIITA
ncbi:histidine kinase [Flavivirga spongiicola]|uniref:Histidine kinase n=1 Tax=Flavivirga spongiicola TaxID=421621 RepID=A0ABU7XXQ3_9FLAO|nr:histidine kinase [Flavivirga sp. MEBiC05379]MDO5980575.1 histidine kinase [Flavivirga sp. MEBiC05379]